MKKYKRVLAALLVLLMCMSLFPVSAFADEEGAAPAEEAVESAEPAAVEEAPLPEGEEAPAEPAAEEEAPLPEAEEVPAEPAAEEEAPLPEAEEAPAEPAAEEEVPLPEEVPAEPAEPAEDDIFLQSIEETEDWDARWNASGLTLNATGSLGNLWGYESLTGYTYNWLSYVPAKPGDTISLWVEVGGFSDPANVTYMWSEGYINEYGSLSSRDTGKRGTAFPDFTMEEERYRYGCKISDGEGTVINVDFDVVIDLGGPDNPTNQDYYSVNIDHNILYGEISTDKIQALTGELVTVTVALRAGFEQSEYELSVTYTDGKNGQQTVPLTRGTGNNINTWTFTMPAHNVTVSAVWAYLRDINIAPVPGGTVSADKTEALAGDTVTLTVSDPEQDYELLYVMYKDDDSGNEHELKPDDGVYSFQMPDNDVTVSAIFAPLVPYKGITFRPWGKYNGYPNGLAGGNWYLYEDVDMGDAAWEIDSDINFFLNGHTLHGDPSGPLIRVEGTLTLYDLDDNSGKISNGSNTGCGVYTLYDDSSFVMNGGTITGCRSGNGNGSGVGVLGGSFTMNGGVITGNSDASHGAGVAVNTDASFTMNGGEISGNSANFRGGGVYVISGATFEISGAPNISGNNGGGSDNNVFLENGAVIKVTGVLMNTIPIGVTTAVTPTAEAPVVITDGLNGKGTAKNFASDNSSFVAELNANLECMLAVPLHITMPADSIDGTVRITDVTGTPITGEPPEYVFNYDIITLKVTPAKDCVLTEDGLTVTYLDENNEQQSVEVARDPGDDANTWFFTMPAHDVTVAAAFASLPLGIALDREYLLMKPGTELESPLTVLNVDSIWDVGWSSEDDNIAAVDGNGIVTAGREAGTTYIVASVRIDADTVFKARCRVDVTANNAGAGISGVQLVDSKATVELYQTGYARIQVVPELTQNNVIAQAVTPELVIVPTPEDTGFAITGAVFEEDSNHTGISINDLFKLRVVDDRTLEIIPKDLARGYGAANDKTLKSSYTASIIVTVDGEGFPAGPLTLTVKKTLPKISAKPVKFNSLLTTDTRPLDFGGVKMVSVEIDGTKTNPDWVTLSGDGGSITYAGAVNDKPSGKLNLLAQPEGWSVKMPVAVSVSAAGTAPKLTLKPASLSLQPNGNDSAVTAVTITPAEFGNCEIVKDNISEGTAPADTVLKVDIRGNEICVSPGSGMPTDGKAHTYKITLDLSYNSEVRTTAVLTVKIPAWKAPTLTLKAVGSINPAVPDSPVTFVPTLKNVGGDVIYAVTAITDANGNDKMNCFEQDGLTLTGKDGLEQGKYTATITAGYGKNESVSKDIAFTVKSTAASPSVTLKTTGGIDVLRPESKVILTPTVKNLYGYTLYRGDVTIEKTYDGATKQAVSEDVTDSFTIVPEGGNYIITKKDAVSHLDKFTVTASVGGVPAAKAVPLSVKMGTAKVAQSTKEVKLLKTDCYSSAPVSLTLDDSSLSGIGRVILISPADKTTGRAYFTLEPTGQGIYEIRFNENLLPPDIANLKAQTVKLQVFLQGNETTDKPNAALSFKVNIA